MSPPILPLAFIDKSIPPDVSASAVAFAILEPALVEIATLSDEEAFAVWSLSASEDLADVLAFAEKRLDVSFLYDEPPEVFGLDDLRSLTVIKGVKFLSHLSYTLVIIY